MTAPRPIAITFIVVGSNGAIAARGTTDDTGAAVAVKLAPGSYTLRGLTEGAPPSVTPQQATVLASAIVPVTLDVDTGIR